MCTGALDDGVALTAASTARQFRPVIEHVLKHRDRIWLTHPGGICEYAQSLPPGIVPGS